MPEPASSLERMIGILDLFEGEAQQWTSDEMHARLGYARSTLYRYLKVLTDAGLLTSLPEVGYTLGPRIAELDYQIRTHDPLIRAARPVMAKLVHDAPGIALLCRRYRDRVLCVHQEHGTRAIRSTYERGRARPLLRGAASRIILAFLPAPRVGRLFAEQPEEFLAAGLGATLAEVRAALKSMRQAGWDVTEGQVTPGVVGIAAPIFDSREAVLGSLSITIPAKSAVRRRVAQIAEQVVAGAAAVTRAIGP